MCGEPDHLIVLHIGTNGLPTEIYNGPGSVPWSTAGAVQKNGQRRISLTTLTRLMQDVDANNQVSSIRSVSDLSK